MKTLKILTALWLLLGAVASAMAQDYQVELVVFKHGWGERQGGIAWEPAVLVPNLSRTVDVGRGGGAGFERADGQRLAEHAAAIDASNELDLLAHLSWRQPQQGRQSATGVRIASGQEVSVYLQSAPPIGAFRRHGNAQFGQLLPTGEDVGSALTQTLNGYITLSVQRYLHLDSHLYYTQSSNERTAYIRGHRRMRSGEVHYIDHPIIGIIATVTPVN